MTWFKIEWFDFFFIWSQILFILGRIALDAICCFRYWKRFSSFTLNFAFTATHFRIVVGWISFSISQPPFLARKNNISGSAFVRASRYFSKLTRLIVELSEWNFIWTGLDSPFFRFFAFIWNPTPDVIVQFRSENNSTSTDSWDMDG